LRIAYWPAGATRRITGSRPSSSTRYVLLNVPTPISLTPMTRTFPKARRAIASISAGVTGC